LNLIEQYEVNIYSNKHPYKFIPFWETISLRIGIT